ncbi:MAG: nucleotidyltransferase family protein [Burkholderiaceae bacterium]|nr:nucleotidyltransferase family protein [Burkholderiaceae bacterium]
MILAAGRGQRMRPLTDTCPKPLLPVHGKPLMQWAMESLAAGGFTRQVVNTDWLGEQISDHFGQNPASNGDESLSKLGGVQVAYSKEGADFGYALETAGGISRALPLLDEIFWVAAGDVFAPGFPFTRAALQRFAASGMLAHLWLVPNPAHNPGGDFALGAPLPDGGDAGVFQALNQPAQAGEPRHTFSTIALYRRALFEPPGCAIAPGNPDGVVAPLAPLLRAAIDAGQVSAELYTGPWTDVGTPERLAQINADPPDTTVEAP